MKKRIKADLLFFLLEVLFFCPDFVVGQNRSDGEFDLYQIRKSSGPVVGLKSGGLVTEKDTCSFSGRFIHQFGLEFRPGYVFPTNSFLAGRNYVSSPVRDAYAAHLKYAFQFTPYSLADRIWGGAYQGIGIGYYSFGNVTELGNPVAVYLFQGARIVSFSSRISFNYEWNFGLSLGWKPYDRENNPYNVMIGSKMNAYINTNFYLNWVLSPYFNLNAGVTLTHFSNGNTRFPNAGLNMMDFKVGLVYHFNRKEACLSKLLNHTFIPVFPRHVSYDLVLFGSWRRKGYFSEEGFVPSPDAYKVMGVNLAAMYNVSYKFRAGIALDWVYDASANVFVLSDPGTSQGFVEPPFNAQIALGLSGRMEYVMPYITVGIGMGANILHRGGDLRSFYQMLILKISMTRNTFLHVGYNLKDFRDPNFLMLGIGFRFNNKYPKNGL